MTACVWRSSQASTLTSVQSTEALSSLSALSPSDVPGVSVWFLLSSSFGLFRSQEGLCNSFSVFRVRKPPSPRLWAFQLSVQPKPIREPKSAEGKHWFWHICQCITQGCFLMQRGVCNPVIFKRLLNTISASSELNGESAFPPYHNIQ